jgi:hypothetical protein
MRSSDSANRMKIRMRAPRARYSGSRKKPASAMTQGRYSGQRIRGSAV